MDLFSGPSESLERLSDMTERTIDLNLPTKRDIPVCSIKIGERQFVYLAGETRYFAPEVMRRRAGRLRAHARRG